MTARTWFEQSGEFDLALERWETLPAAQKTFNSFRVMIQKEFAKHNKHDKQTAKGTGRGLANSITAAEEAEIQAMAMAEFVNAVTAQTNAQMEKMMEMFKEAMSAKPSGVSPNTTFTHPKCPHCSRRHPKPDDCWELEKNASKRPKNWKPVAERKKKCGEEKSSEQWRPGKVEINKLTKGFTYLVTSGLSPPPPKRPDPPPTSSDQKADCFPQGVDCCIKAVLPPPLSKVSKKWARRVNKWKERRKKRVEEEALLDSAATSSFTQSGQGLQLTGKSDKFVRAANGGLMKAESTALFGLSKLRTGAREALVVPELKPKALVSVSPLANNGYTTIFHPYDEGVTVHDANTFELTFNAPPVLQGCRNTAGLWTVPITDHATISQSLNVDEAAMNVYELPSTKEVVRFLHAALGFPTKATLLTAAKKGNLITFPGLTPENITKHFPESDETQKGHMRHAPVSAGSEIN
eukprot:scaffold10112_cov34-Cyclotella_meneghiniana.AAC.2